MDGAAVQIVLAMHFAQKLVSRCPWFIGSSLASKQPLSGALAAIAIRRQTTRRAPAKPLRYMGRTWTGVPGWEASAILPFPMYMTT